MKLTADTKVWVIKTGKVESVRLFDWKEVPCIGACWTEKAEALRVLLSEINEQGRKVMKQLQEENPSEPVEE